ncbi:MAG: kynureninase [Calditrichia bacterium]
MKKNNRVLMDYQPGKDFALQMDANDPLRAFREQFFIPKQNDDGECIYLCGNSLGLQPKNVRQFIEQELRDWQELGVEGHFRAKNPWMPYHEYLSEPTARLVGAKPGEVVVMNSLTVNLHLMMVSFYRPTPARHKILIEYDAFPSDQYAVKSQIKFHGYHPENSLIELKPRSGEEIVRIEEIRSLMEQEGQSIALILVGAVNYYSGQLYDIKEITRLGHEYGCVVGFDLAHAVGNVLLNLHDWQVDFAVWCSYKYLNSGPGGIAGCFVHEKHARGEDIPRFAGWWGHNKENRFLMHPEFEPIPGAEGWQLSNPPILPLAALRASMEIFTEAGMNNLRRKSVLLTGYLEYLIQQLTSPQIRIITPSDPDQRGCQLSIQTGKNGQWLYKQITSAGVVCDWREPDVIRVAPAPLYNTYEDVYNFVEILKKYLRK